MPEKVVIASKALKASSVGIATSSGGISLGILQISPDMIVLALIGLVVSLIAFGYDHHHSNVIETRMAIITNAAQYMLFGMFALPSGFMAVNKYITNDVMSCMLGGVFFSWTVVAFVKAVKNRGLKEVEGRKL